MNVGILGISAYLPPVVRDNAWWPAHITQQWQSEKIQMNADFSAGYPLESLPRETRLVIEALNQQNKDVFAGARTRYVMPDNQKTTDMEIVAAKEALAISNLKASDIDFLICQTTLPDNISEANANVVHKALNLKADCFTQDVSGMCNGFLSQMQLAQAFIKSGIGKYGLLIQSSGTSRYLLQDNPISPMFGDGASAVVVGPASADEGLLAMHHYTNAQLSNFAVAGIPGKDWYDEGKIIMYIRQPEKGLLQFIKAIEAARKLVTMALKSAHLILSDIDFYASHQAAAWFCPVSQSAIGLEQATTLNTYPAYANISAVNIPLVLSLAQRDKLIRRGDKIAAYSVGTGLVATGAILTWLL